MCWNDANIDGDPTGARRAMVSPTRWRHELRATFCAFRAMRDVLLRSPMPPVLPADVRDGAERRSVMIDV